MQALGLPPRDALLAHFDVLDDWYRRRDYAGCPVVKAVLESRTEDPLYTGALQYFSSVRGYLRNRAAEAGVRDPHALATQWHILIWGSIIGARAKEADAARRAKELAAAILAQENRPARQRHQVKRTRPVDRKMVTVTIFRSSR